jgi:hypothetical protein
MLAIMVANVVAYTGIATSIISTRAGADAYVEESRSSFPHYPPRLWDT